MTRYDAYPEPREAHADCNMCGEQWNTAEDLWSIGCTHSFETIPGMGYWSQTDDGQDKWSPTLDGPYQTLTPAEAKAKAAEEDRILAAYQARQAN